MHISLTCADPEGRQGVRTPPPLEKNHQNIGFLSNTGPAPLKNHKATESVFNFGPLSARQRNAIKWRLADGPMMARWPAYSGICLDPLPSKKKKKKKKKTLSKLDPL